MENLSNFIFNLIKMTIRKHPKIIKASSFNFVFCRLSLGFLTEANISWAQLCPSSRLDLDTWKRTMDRDLLFVTIICGKNNGFEILKIE
jgi:hypothetical protein